MLEGYVFASTIVFSGLALIWDAKNELNFVIKIALISLALWGGTLLFS